MPILKAIVKNKKRNNYKQTPTSFKMLLNYITRKGKDQNEVYKSFGIGLSDNPEKAFRQTLFNWETHDTKEDIRLYKHYIKSYPVGYKDLETIEKITREFTEKNFLERGFKCYVAIHRDKEHIHAHIITDCTNFLTGYKLQELSEVQLNTRYKNKELRSHEFTLDQLKNNMEEIAKSYGLDSPKRAKEKEKNTSKNIGNMAKYKALEKEDSYRNKIASIWESVVLETTTTLENLKEKLEEKGISITRYTSDGRPLTLTTNYADTKGVQKTGKSKLTTLEKEEDYRFNITPNLYNWHNVLEILSKHKDKEITEEITIEDIEKTIKELEKEVALEKEFKKLEKEFIKYKSNPKMLVEISIDPEKKSFFTMVDNYIKDVKENKKEITADKIQELKQSKEYEFILEFNTNADTKKKEQLEKEKAEEERKEIEKKEVEEKARLKREQERILKNMEYNEKHDKLREKERIQEDIRTQKNREIADYVEERRTIKEVNKEEVKPAEQKENKKGKDKGYGE